MNVKETNKKKNMKPILIAGAAVACLGIAGVSAYFTDSEKLTNTFTVGKVDITPSEPSWPDENPPEDIVPNQEFPKDPKISNVGANPAYVFLQVKIPTADVKVANDDGTDKETALTELFAMQGLNTTDWCEIGDPFDYTDEDNHTFKVYTFAYGPNAAKAPTILEIDDGVDGSGKDETPPLFTSVRFANVIEGQNLGMIEPNTLNVDVISYAIQTDWLSDTNTDAADDHGTNKLSATQVWQIFATQNANKVLAKA